MLTLGRVQAAADVEGQALLDEGHQGSACKYYIVHQCYSSMLFKPFEPSWQLARSLSCQYVTASAPLFATKCAALRALQIVI